jgi:hypothetical protein
MMGIIKNDDKVGTCRHGDESFGQSGVFTWHAISTSHFCKRFLNWQENDQMQVQSNFDKRDSLKREKAYYREVFCAL